MNRPVSKKKLTWQQKLLALPRSRKVLLGVIGLLLLLGVTAVFAKKSPPVQYQTATAERGTLVSDVTASGNISSGNSVSVTTAASGVVQTVYVKNGDYVVQGQPIADITLDSSSQQKQVAAYASYLSAQNTLNAAKSKMDSLQSSLFKANQTFVQDAGKSDTPNTSDPKYIEENADWHQAEADYTNQQGVIDQANVALNSAWLAYTQISSQITAPTSGTISSLAISPGSVIGSSGSTSQASSSQNSSNSTSSSSSTNSSGIATISLANSQLTATVNLSEIDVTQVKVGQKVTLTLDAFPDKTFTGHVSSIDTSGTVSSGVTTYPTTITFDSAPSDIYPNMGVNATIITSIKTDVITVPSTAVQTSNGQSTVRVMKNGKPAVVDVTTGASNDTDTEITSGLNEGDVVVTGSTATSTGSSQTASPFSGLGGRGFGGGGGVIFRTGGGGGGGQRVGNGG